MSIISHNIGGNNFAADVADIIVGSSTTITFQLQKGGTTVLEEQFSPDSNNRIRISGLPKILNMLLGGTLGFGSQSGTRASFSFVVGSETVTGNVRSCWRRNTVQPNIPYSSMLSLAASSVLVAGLPHILTLGDTVTDYNEGLSDNTTEISNANHTIYIDRGVYPRAVCFRFLNNYDVPQSVVCRNGIKVKPSVTSDDAKVYGVTRRFAVESDDEFTADSGAIKTRDEYIAFWDMMNSRQVQVMTPLGTWEDVIITKPGYTQGLWRSSFDKVEFSFKMADALSAGALLV